MQYSLPKHQDIATNIRTFIDKTKYPPADSADSPADSADFPVDFADSPADFADSPADFADSPAEPIS
jgi:hypothetical protein